MAGSTTSVRNDAIAASRICSCSSSFERKCAKRPLLDMPVASARRPSVTPPIPSVLASSIARETIR